MLFNSFSYFLLLLVARLLVAFSKWPAFLLLLASIVFYSFAGTFDCAVFFVSLVVNWLIARFFTGSRLRIIIAALLNIGLLGFFKYFDFFMGHGRTNGNYIDIGLPLGISFYTFQILAYQIDVARGLNREASSFRTFALFITFFPQHIAGPIVRANKFLPQIERIVRGQRRRVYLVSYGLSLLASGLFKKIVLADSISPFVDEVFGPGPENAAWAWLGAVLFAFQIYFDFSGYSDMAIGSACLLGFRLPVNFKTPYLSTGPREFWQRWHITLSTWIRDYLYIPLGGSRGGDLRKALVLVATMTLAGLWHGAGVTFVMWGAGWGLFILAERLLSGRIAAPRPLAWLATFIVTLLLWVLFRAPDIGSAAHYLGVMLGLSAGAPSRAMFHAEKGIFNILVPFILLLFPLHYGESRLNNKRSLYFLKRYNGIFTAFLLASVCVALLLVQRSDVNPFIYFRF